MASQEEELPVLSSCEHGGGKDRVGCESRAKKKVRKQILLRLDPAVYAAVAKWASDDLRSVNAQIEILLRRALKEAGRAADAEPLRGRGRPRKDSPP